MVGTASIVPEMADCVVNIVNPFSGDRICIFEYSASATVLEIKRLIKALQGTSPFCQSLFLPSADSPLADNAVLASLASSEAAMPSGDPIKLVLVVNAWIDEDLHAISGLLDAADIGDRDRVEEPLRMRTWPDAVDDGGQTSLIVACWQGHLAVAELLLEAGADKDKAIQHGTTALHAASFAGRVEIARLLLEAGADKDKADEHGRTALHAASFAGQVEIARLLLEAEADKDKADEDGRTALHDASEQAHLEVVELLLEAEANKDNVEQDGSTALHDASEQGHLEVVELLLEAGADKDKAAQDGATALLLATAKRHVDIVQLLQEQEVEVTGKRRRIMAAG